MSLRALQPPDRYRASLPTSYLADSGQKGASLELLRLFGLAAVATVFFVGGVYWLRLQMSGGPVGQQQASIVNVHLMPRPEPASIPAAPASRSTVVNNASRADTSVKEASPLSEDAVVIPHLKAYSPAEVPPVMAGLSSTDTGAAPDSAAVKFQQALLRHVARFQRYPNAARALNLQGKVDMRFSLSRDGTLLGVWVKTGSGQVVLDKEAIDTIRRAQPLPAIPRELPDRLNVQLQLEFAPS